MPVGIYLFRRFPVRVAILANFLAGWALLPGANYRPTTEEFPYWILGVCLPTNYFLTKATVTGLAGLGGMLLFHFADLKRIRLAICDIPMAVWCCVPLISAAAHWNTLREGLFGAAYQTISWGVPWLLGRTYFSDHESLLLAAKAYVVAGLTYVPICLVEICVGPQLYAILYGYQPYRWVGAERYLGYRPIGFLEDGNQLGIWMAAATLIAVSFFARRRFHRIHGLSPRWIAAVLAVTTLLCQSVGSIVLLLFLVPLTWFRRRSVLRASVAVLVLCIVVFAAFRMTNQVSLRALAKRNGTLHSIANGLASIGRQSFAWRIARDESHIAMALRNPLLGSGQWDWWQGRDSRPWSLWLLVFGMYGAVGLIAFGAIVFLPLIHSGWSPVVGNDRDDSDLRRTMIALILLVALDNLLNGAMILPYLLAMGGLASREPSMVPVARSARRPLAYTPRL
jgi:hypothetical protein